MRFIRARRDFLDQRKRMDNTDRELVSLSLAFEDKVGKEGEEDKWFYVESKFKDEPSAEEVEDVWGKMNEMAEGWRNEVYG